MARPRSPRIVMLGGGTGTFTVLSALKYYVQDITAVVNMVDDGGSTGVLRDELGVLPPGDVRQSLVALASRERALRDLFNYRFEEGALAGHAFGNLFLTALEKTTGSFARAVELAGEILAIQGRVVPATTSNVRLVLESADGRTVHGEALIGEGSEVLFRKGIPHRLYLEPEAELFEGARKAIREADMIIIGPGKLYSSLLPSFLIRDMADELSQSKAKKVYICNLMTQPTQTAGFLVQDFASELERYAGGPILDYVIYNTARPASAVLDSYRQAGEELVGYDLADLEGRHYQAVGEPLVSKAAVKPTPGDTLRRTLIRHDNDRLARLIMRLYFS